MTGKEKIAIKLQGEPWEASSDGAIYATDGNAPTIKRMRPKTYEEKTKIKEKAKILEQRMLSGQETQSW